MNQRGDYQKLKIKIEKLSQYFVFSHQYILRKFTVNNELKYSFIDILLTLIWRTQKFS